MRDIVVVHILEFLMPQHVAHIAERRVRQELFNVREHVNNLSIKSYFYEKYMHYICFPCYYGNTACFLWKTRYFHGTKGGTRSTYNNGNNICRKNIPITRMVSSGASMVVAQEDIIKSIKNITTLEGVSKFNPKVLQDPKKDHP